MTTATKIDINVAAVTKVYSGRPGCGCGCKGTYWTDMRNIVRITKIMQARADEVTFEDGIYSLQDENRYYWAYTV